MNDQSEIWRTIPSEPNYEASSLGRIRRVTSYISTFVGRILTPRDNGTGYLCVSTCTKGTRRIRYVHHLVTEAFYGPRPPMHVAAHLNGQRSQNQSGNLAWVTGSENEAHKASHGTRRTGEKSPHAKLSDDDVRLIRAHVAFGATMLRTANVFGVGFSTVQRIVKGHSRVDAGGYILEK